MNRRVLCVLASLWSAAALADEPAEREERAERAERAKTTESSESEESSEEHHYAGTEQRRGEEGGDAAGRLAESELEQVEEDARFEHDTETSKAPDTTP